MKTHSRLSDNLDFGNLFIFNSHELNQKISNSSFYNQWLRFAFAIFSDSLAGWWSSVRVVEWFRSLDFVSTVRDSVYGSLSFFATPLIGIASCGPSDQLRDRSTITASALEPFALCSSADLAESSFDQVLHCWWCLLSSLIFVNPQGKHFAMIVTSWIILLLHAIKRLGVCFTSSLSLMMYNQR